MRLQFHHFFVFAPPGAPQADRLVEAGFREGPGNRHPGQGTANRRFFFDNGMLEFLWIEDREEAAGPDVAPTRLEERSRFRETGFAPFGVATHGPLEGSVLIPPFPCWSYSPPYLQPDQEIWVADNAAYPGEPMLFYAGFFPPPGRPAAGFLDHPNGVRCVSALTLERPATGHPCSLALSVFSRVHPLYFREGEKLAAVLEWDGAAQGRELDLGPEIPLAIKY